ncbi:sirohydrochlorin chelatase [Paraburkholderia fungorum]|jgi:sirohydrochlorin cobaltochelatase|uniref:CbiX family protein n=1 Tax=Paraburkholderia fungorum TaxID=134537 RepID=A0AAJ3SK18_9BURK|nr:CbiX/SirB N-terminal domain-containing protein [Paraburkholderia fungorum]KFX60446.1 cobalamin biosynthesis protein CbiX [Burkholderia sp. K24]AJZ59263.1 cbiX family protein [Paraburkholderia fungorum]MBB4517893.1 sirohydrochlorin cobaltochelatase [Paraburkholderia fungorum]MBB5542965.1 sirohydrochlorin cobaltochelatase [Paraburkholderia fungorum]MBB6205862.1 sirohydrochlorin cobaltochelatase [Paraburkholderia fungorum]
MATHGMVLFAHGARDVRWREPFERLAGKVRAARGSDAEAGPVLLAFLELMEPDLPTAVGSLVADGCSVVTVVPVFFGQGGHVRRDLPEVIERCRGMYPSVRIQCAGAVGEDEAVLEAVAEYCLRQG